MNSWLATEGSPSPLGVAWIEEEQAFNFALYSKYASQVTLLLYTESDLVHPYDSPGQRPGRRFSLSPSEVESVAENTDHWKGRG